MDLKLIKTEAEHEAALAEMSRLWGSSPGTPEGDKLDVLGVLINVYESEHYPIDPPSPIEAIKFRMEQGGLTRKDLEAYLGGKNRVSEVLSGKRHLSVKMISRLHNGLKIPLESLFQQKT
jgi:HTH-type transcriptional regulator/antitoxin HigA